MNHAGPTTGSRSPRDFSVFVPLTVVQIAPYFLGVCTIMVGSVCGYANYFETEEEPLWHAVPFVLQLWLGFLAVNFLLSLVGDHAKHDGSPAFMLIPNVCCQFILIPAIYYYAFTTRTERLGGAGAGQMDAWEFHARPVGGANSGDQRRLDNLIVWVTAAMMVKDLPWLFAYKCKMMQLHHVASLALAFVVLHQVPSGMFCVAGTVIAEFGSGWYTFIVMRPESKVVNVLFLWLTTFSNIAAYGLFLCYAYTAPPFTVPWCFMLVVLTVVGYMRQSVTLKLYGNFKRTGTAYPDDMLDIDGKRKKK